MPPYYARFSGAEFIQVSSKKLKIRVNQFTNSPVESFDIFCSYIKHYLQFEIYGLCIVPELSNDSEFSMNARNFDHTPFKSKVINRTTYLHQ